MRVGVLEILIADVDPSRPRRFTCRFLNRHYASIMPQAVSVWCRSLGHETFYATYWGQGDPKGLLPDDLDVVFLAAYTSASTLAAALAKLYRRDGALTVLGGPHAKGFPEDALRFFDVVVQDCDRRLIEELLVDRPRGEVLRSGRPLRELPTVEERLPELHAAHFVRGKAAANHFVPLLSSLGCPYDCDFCADWDNPYRLAPLDQLEADLRYVSEHFPRVLVPFHDPNFAIRFDEVLGVLERIPVGRRNRYAIQTSLSVLSEPRLRRLADTRCVFLAPGVESWHDYSNKARVASTHDGWRKLEEVVACFELVRRHIPALQANFIFGIDGDAGPEPVEITKEFARRIPDVWPNLNVPTPFGGTPLYDRHLAEGRILGAMPFALYYTPYLVTRLRSYSAEEFYGHLVDVFALLVSPELVWKRTRRMRGAPVQFLHGLRLLNARRLLAELTVLRDRLRSDRQFRRFHDGEDDRLPAFYQERLRGLLGRYLDLLSPEDLRPRLVPGRAAHRVRGPTAVSATA